MEWVWCINMARCSAGLGLVQWLHDLTVWATLDLLVDIADDSVAIVELSEYCISPAHGDYNGGLGLFLQCLGNDEALDVLALLIRFALKTKQEFALQHNME
ncbi:hypothetical protein Pelo_19285 [Pelomyxa schiedti]|nr:hypothetical protein Pelo_19285 [Pelomyxa schiedti]